METVTKKRKGGIGIYIFCLILLFNPDIKLIDIFPDFIAYFILIRKLYDISQKAPYFHELRSTLIKLCILNIARFPVFLWILSMGTNLSIDHDMITVATLAFSFAEGALSLFAVNYCFKAILYLGQRSGAEALLLPFPTSRSTKSSPEALQSFSSIFLVTKAALCFLPEMLMLTEDSFSTNGSPLRAYYLPALFASILVVTVIGIIWTVYSRGYISAIRESDAINVALSEFVTEEKLIYIEKRKAYRKRSNGLNIMIFSAFLSFDLCFSNLGDIDLIPNVIFGAVFSYGLFSFFKEYKKIFLLRISCILYCAVSLVSYILSVSFLSKYDYTQLPYWQEARNHYTLVSVFSVLELLALAFMLLSVALKMRDYVRFNTGVPASSEKYTAVEEKYDRPIIRKGFIFAAVGVAVGIVKCVNAFLQFSVRYVFIDISNPLTDTMATTSIPWFESLIMVLCAVFAAYSFHYFNSIKELHETEFIKDKTEALVD